MRIQHNIPAMNSYRNYTNNTSALAKNLEKLSSGYKINRAGDDAAGLAISEKMRAQITGLEVAQKNAKDGISLVKTAEGALTEVHDMLNRMYELAEQSANGTYDNDVDRAQLQKEITSLSSEIDRIADSSNFNGIKLLDGSLAGGSTAAGEKISVGSKIASAAGLLPTENAATNTSWTSANAIQDPASTDIDAGTMTFTVKDASGVATEIEVDISAVASGGTQADANTSLINDLQANKEFSKLFDVSVDTSNKLVITAKNNGTSIVGIASADTNALGTADADITTTKTDATIANTTLEIDQNAIAKGDIITVGGTTYEFVEDADSATTTKGATAVVLGDDYKGTIENLDKALKENGYTVTRVDDSGDPVDDAAAASEDVLVFSKVGAQPGVGGGVAGSGGLTLQIGDTAEDFNKLTVSVKDMHVSAMGIGSIDISKQPGASDAMAKVKEAINYVSDVRGTLGATQNRLDHTINNLSVMQENIQDAESSIRDVDVAKEMMEYTKNNILVQSAQAMLAQANQLPQGVLQLLQ